METKKGILNFCNEAVYYDYKSFGIVCELNQVRKCIINTFHETIPGCRIILALSIIDDLTLKLYGNEIEYNLENIHDLRENVIYMLSFEKTVNDKQQTIRPILNDNDEE